MDNYSSTHAECTKAWACAVCLHQGMSSVGHKHTRTYTQSASTYLGGAADRVQDVLLAQTLVACSSQ
jgi:hypothetical protein